MNPRLSAVTRCLEHFHITNLACTLNPENEWSSVVLGVVIRSLENERVTGSSSSSSEEKQVREHGQLAGARVDDMLETWEASLSLCSPLSLTAAAGIRLSYPVSVNTDSR